MTPLHLVIFLFIGHSNMTGYCAAMDTVKAPHVWSYSAARGFYNCDDRDLESGAGSPVMPFLKRMALLYPGYDFCGIRFAGPCRQAFHVLAEQRHREAIQNVIAQTKGKATYGGVLFMFGFVESAFNGADYFDTALVKLVSFLRYQTETPGLPVILGKFEENGNHVIAPQFYKFQEEIVSKINRMPRLIENLSLTPFKPMPKDRFCDDHHYDAEGYRIWSWDAATIYKYSGYDRWARK